MNIASTFLKPYSGFACATITKYLRLIHALRLQGGKVKTRNSDKLTRWDRFSLTFLTRRGCVPDNYACCKAQIHSWCYFEIATGFNSSLGNGCLKTKLHVWINNCFICSLTIESDLNTKAKLAHMKCSPIP